jgi:uncharacterized protein YgiM (DUF1202 family)
LHFYAIEGTIVRLLEEDDGSGWIKVEDGKGAKGLVPASYIEAIEEDAQQGILQRPHPANGRPKPEGKPASLGSGVYGQSILYLMNAYIILTRLHGASSTGFVHVSGKRSRRTRR